MNLMVHWSNYRTKLALYKFEVRKLTALRKHKTEGIIYSLFYRHKIKYYMLAILNINAYLDQEL